MRFCTSRSLNTSTTSARLSDRPTNSICDIEACCVRGSVTTPARRVTFDSNCDAAATSAFESSREASSWRRNSANAGSSSIGRARLEQRIDEEAVTLVGRNAPRRGVRRANKAELLEVGDDVADGRRGQRQTRLAGQGPRPDRLAIADIAADEHPQQQLFALGKCIVGGLVHWGEATFACNRRVKERCRLRHSTVFDVIQCIGRLCVPCYKAAWLYRRKLAR